MYNRLHQFFITINRFNDNNAIITDDIHPFLSARIFIIPKNTM